MINQGAIEKAGHGKKTLPRQLRQEVSASFETVASSTERILEKYPDLETIKHERVAARSWIKAIKK